jgi:hypothetical protein
MNPQLITALAAQHNRELTTQATGGRALAARPRPRRPGRRMAFPYHITWTRVRLALSDGGRSRTSWTVVISATRVSSAAAEQGREEERRLALR